jgi:hypothetical protein
MKAGDKYNGIYCHSDGYIEHNGLLLYLFYNTDSKVRNLIGLGDLSSLGARLGRKCDMNKVFTDKEYYERMRMQCKAYSRDRGEDWNVSTCKDKEDLACEAYTYLWRDGAWYLIKTNPYKETSLEKALYRHFKSNLKEAKQELSGITQGMTEEEKAVVIEYAKQFVNVGVQTTKADFIVEKQEKEKFLVRSTVNNSKAVLSGKELFALQLEGKTIVRKWGNGYRAFHLDDSKYARAFY